jgi:tetratricopeptide (TPR) repeat protein
VEAALARRAWYGRLDDESLRLRAEAAERRGNPLGAARWLLAIAPASRAAAALRVRAGALLLGAFHLRDSEDAYRSALAIDERSEEAVRALIVISGVAKRADEQEQWLWKLHELGDRPTRIEALRLLAPGVAVIPPDSLPRGIDEAQLLNRAVAADPSDSGAASALADLLVLRGRSAEARQMLDGLPRPTSTRDEQARSEAYGAIVLDEASEAEAERHFRPLPRTARGWSQRGEWLTLHGHHADAAEAFAKAVALDRRDPHHRYRWSRALQATGDTDEARRQLGLFQSAEELKVLTAGIDEQAPDPASLRRAAELCRALGRDREASAWADLAREASRPEAEGPR